MELLVQPKESSRLIGVTPPFVARYRAVLWEPIFGTGERLVALVAIEPHEATGQAVSPATYPVIAAPRLRRLLGRERGNASANILRECAQFMTQRQQAGLPLDELRPLFRGFEPGPVMVARAWGIEQLLDAAVRSVSAFGSAEEMIEEEESRQSPRHTVRTSEFLTQLRRIFVGHAKELASRFDVPLNGLGDVPDVVVDYADGPLVVQVTSLPSTERQAEHTEREAEAKLFQLSVARKQMSGNAFTPTLLFNTDALAESAGSEAHKHAEATYARLVRFAKFEGVRILEAPSPGIAARLLDTQHDYG